MPGEPGDQAGSKDSRPSSVRASAAGHGLGGRGSPLFWLVIVLIAVAAAASLRFSPAARHRMQLEEKEAEIQQRVDHTYRRGVFLQRRRDDLRDSPAAMEREYRRRFAVTRKGETAYIVPTTPVYAEPAPAAFQPQRLDAALVFRIAAIAVGAIMLILLIIGFDIGRR